MSSRRWRPPRTPSSSSCPSSAARRCRWRARVSTRDGTPPRDRCASTPRRRPRQVCALRSPRSSSLPLNKVDCVAPMVGGGFGVKIVHPWPEEVLVPWAARELDRRGEVGRGSTRALRLLGARARPAPHHQGGVRRRRSAARVGRQVLARQRRVHALRDHRPDHHLHPAARSVQARRLPRGVLVALHQHGDRHALPRRRSSAGLFRDGAHPRRHRRRTRARPGRGAAATTSSRPRRCPTTTSSSSRTAAR